MSEARLPPIAELLPHGPRAILLDGVDRAGDQFVRCWSVVKPDTPFIDQAEGLPAHVAIELMAQACGVFAGIEAWRSGRAIRLAYLLGTRRFKSEPRWFRVGERLAIEARLLFRDEQIGMFDTSIERSGVEVVRAQLSVYQPLGSDTVRLERT